MPKKEKPKFILRGENNRQKVLTMAIIQLNIKQ
jgi:hypothetical protein